MMNWGTQYTPAGIVFAIAGGIIGAVITSRADNDGWPRTLAEALVAAFAAAALGEYYLPLTRVWVCGFAGVAVGLVAGYALDAVRETAPAVKDVARETVPAIVRAFLEKFAGKKKDE